MGGVIYGQQHPHGLQERIRSRRRLPQPFLSPSSSPRCWLRDVPMGRGTQPPLALCVTLAMARGWGGWTRFPPASPCPRWHTGDASGVMVPSVVAGRWQGGDRDTGMCGSGAVSKETPAERGLRIPPCPPHTWTQPPGASLREEGLGWGQRQLEMGLGTGTGTGTRIGTGTGMGTGRGKGKEMEMGMGMGTEGGTGTGMCYGDRNGNGDRDRERTGTVRGQI